MRCSSRLSHCPNTSAHALTTGAHSGPQRACRLACRPCPRLPLPLAAGVFPPARPPQTRAPAPVAAAQEEMVRRTTRRSKSSASTCRARAWCSSCSCWGSSRCAEAPWRHAAPDGRELRGRVPEEGARFLGWGGTRRSPARLRAACIEQRGEGGSLVQTASFEPLPSRQGRRKHDLRFNKSLFRFTPRISVKLRRPA